MWAIRRPIVRTVTELTAKAGPIRASELRHLAAAAGLGLAHRWGDWGAAAYDPMTARKHISVYHR